jgi:predicted ATP-dependent endonuclease of OLD family
MHVEKLRIKNFRRLKDVTIDLADDVSIFVGANNSGKTSASRAVELFTKGRAKNFSVYEYNAECWTSIDRFGESAAPSNFPRISLDIWLAVDAANLHRVIDLIPSLKWKDKPVGLRIELAPKDEAELHADYKEARSRALTKADSDTDAGSEDDYEPSPRNMRDYVAANLGVDFELRYFLLDHSQFDGKLCQKPGYQPPLLNGGREVLKSLLQVDFLNAQRHLSDGASSNRAETLSRRLSHFYERNLEKREEDHNTLRELARAEKMLSKHLEAVFEPTLSTIKGIGYPGPFDPSLRIKSALKPSWLMSNQEAASVHYVLNDGADEGDELTLPDRYNGLGFKNLIYMIVELLDLHAQWLNVEENRPPIHLVFVEEPEAHLHAQIQQAFIREVTKIVAVDEADIDPTCLSSQLVVTTHSPHIVYERGFKPIRYFRRDPLGAVQASDVLNLSEFPELTGESDPDFLERYLKLTHCDLFFADAAVLVEGNVERLLLPQMIENEAPNLGSSYLSILEVGGAFAHRFRRLVNFLKLTTLVITDLDSVYGPKSGEGSEEPEETAIGDEESTDIDDANSTSTQGSTCIVHEAGAITCNKTLKDWLPQKEVIAELLNATEEARTQQGTETEALVRVAFQGKVDVTWQGVTESYAGRTFEEQFALENLEWCQQAENKALKLRIRGNNNKSLIDLVGAIHKKVSSSNFKKTDFALALLAQEPSQWQVPVYIKEGLLWLDEQVSPLSQSGASPPPLAVTQPSLDGSFDDLAADGGQEQ